MNESKWMPAIERVAQRPNVYTTNKEKLSSERIIKLLEESRYDLEDLFATFKQDRTSAANKHKMVFDHIISNLRGIIDTIEQSTDGPLPPQTEPALDDVYRTLTQLLASHRELFDDEEWKRINHEARHLYESTLTDIDNQHEETQTIMNREALAFQEGVNNYHRMFKSVMNMSQAQIETVVKEFLAEGKPNPEQVLTESLQKIMQTIASEWNKLPSEDSPNQLREVRDRCYGDKVEILGHLRDTIESLHLEAKLSPHAYQTLRESFESIFADPEQPPYQGTSGE